MVDAPYFEVRCEHCQSSFAPETKRCIHCGGPLGKRLLSFEGAGVTPRPSAGPTARGVPRADGQPSIGRFLRYALIALAIAAGLLRRYLENP
jgi:ribosomal protein L37E